MQVPQIQIRVIDLEGNPIEGAQFHFARKGAEGSLTHIARPMDLGGLYMIHLQDLQEGTHIFKVMAGGYDTHEEEAHFLGHGYGDTVVLVPAGEKPEGLHFVGKGRRPVILKPQMVRLKAKQVNAGLHQGKQESLEAKKIRINEIKLPAMLVKGDEDSTTAKGSKNAKSDGKPTLKLLKDEITPSGKRHLIVERVDAKVEMDLGEDWEVESEGAVLVPGAGPLFPDGFFYVRWHEEYGDRTMREKVLQLLGLRRIPLVLEAGKEVLYMENPKPTLWALECYMHLLGMKEILEVTPGVIGEDIETAFPADLLRPVQWNLNLLNVITAWDEGTPLGVTYGSADVIIAVNDSGIETTGGGVVSHPEFSGVVAGGTLGALIGNFNKVYYQIDLQQPPAGLIANNNDQNAPAIAGRSNHGSLVTGIVSALQDGANGFVGIAANTRLMSVIRSNQVNDLRRSQSFLFLAGFNPMWSTAGPMYAAGEVFTPLFGQQGNPGPGAFVINCSHTLFPPAPVSPGFRDTLQRVVSVGRSRRGVAIVAASGNFGTDTRPGSNWGNEVNVLKVGAVAITSLGEEVQAGYSCYSLTLEPNFCIDVVAPSRSSINRGATPHMPPALWGIPSTAFITQPGQVPNTATTIAPVLAMGVAVAGLVNVTTITVSAANFALFPAGTSVVIRDTGNIESSEVANVTGPAVAPNTVMLDRQLQKPYGAAAQIITSPNLHNIANFGGTSAAAPQVSGVIGLMLSVKPSLTWAEIRDILRTTAVPVNLRAQDTAAPLVMRRWVDAANNNILDAQGQLLIAGGAGPFQVCAVDLPVGTTQIPVPNAALYAVKQTILIGAESTLAGAAVVAPTNTITVTRDTEFRAGETIWIGKQVQTSLIRTAVIGATQINVVSVDGFAINDLITITSAGGTEIGRITGFANFPSGGEGQVTLINFTYLGPILPVAVGLTIAHPVGSVVAISTVASVAPYAPFPAMLEGPFTINAKLGGNQLQLNANVNIAHPGGGVTVVASQNAELRAVISIDAGANTLEVAPLNFTHNRPALPNPQEIPISGGPVVVQSFGLGFGRVDAQKAVNLARTYTHPRDLYIRNFLIPAANGNPAIEDDGVANSNTQPVDSPDLWVTNDAATAAGLAYNAPGPHQNPVSDISAPLFIGSGLNDLAVSGAYTGAAAGEYIIEIATSGATDQIRWVKDNGVFSAPINIVAGAMAIAEGLSVTFNAITGHTVGERWYIYVQPIANRNLHLRYKNRGTLPTFARSTGANNIPVQTGRVMLCISDGGPAKQYFQDPAGLAAAAPLMTDNLQVMSDFGGAAKVTYTIHIDSVGATDTFQWAMDGGGLNPPAGGTPIVAGATVAIGAGANAINIQFTAATGHTQGDRWVLKCHPSANPANKWINVDHFPDHNTVPAVTPNFVSANLPGTWLMDDRDTTVIAAGADRYYNVNWLETARPPRNGFGTTLPTRPRHFFLLGETLPHDGALMADYCEGDNNMSYRELSFTRAFLRDGTGFNKIRNTYELPSGGTSNEAFTVHFVSDVGTFTTENLEVKFDVEKSGNVTESRTYKYVGGAWTVVGGAIGWLAINPPVRTGTAAAATLEQWSATFNGTLNLDRTISKVTITARLKSSVRDNLYLVTLTQAVAVLEASALPSNRFGSTAAADLVPKSHFFAVPATLTQTDQQAYGPVVDPGDATALEKRYRVTSIFRSATDVKAYAITSGWVQIQRNATNANLVNLILKPQNQPLNGLTNVKYFIYRGLTLSHFLKGTSAADEVEVRASAGSSDFITELWARYLDQNVGAVTLPASVLGWVPAATATDPIDTLFYKEDANFQAPHANKGMYLGDFFANAGAQDFGLEIILEEGEYQPDLNYARKTSHEVDVSAMASGTDAEKFLLKLKREEILNYMDPAAFFGLHASDGGQLQVADGLGNVSSYTVVADIYNNVLTKFHTKNSLYIDIRNEHGNSLNFTEAYDDGTAAHNALDVGATAAGIAAQLYATSKWPILIRSSVGAANANDYNEVHIRFQTDYNHTPVLYVEHGRLLTVTAKPRFVSGTEILAAAGDATSKTIGFRYPNRDAGAGNKDSISWLIKLQYCLRIDAANDPFPAKVLVQKELTDNLFGPVDIKPLWSTTHTLKWSAVQDKKLVDGTTAGFSYIAQRGVAFEGLGAAERVIFFAGAREILDSTTNTFVLNKGITGGTSSKADFFSESKNLSGYNLVYDQASEGGVRFTTLYFSPSPDAPQPTSSVLVAGITKAQFDTLQAIATLSTAYPRNLAFEEVAGSPFTVDGKTYRKFKTGLRGYKADGTTDTVWPGVDIHSYTVDGYFHFTKDFSAAQPVPTSYTRTYEEAMGALKRAGRRYAVKTVAIGPKEFTIEAIDLRRYIRATDVVTIKNSTHNDGNYTVNTVSLSGINTVVKVNEAIPNNVVNLGYLHEPERTYEDYFIGLDQDGALPGAADNLKKIVDDFAAAVTAVPNNNTAKAALQAHIDTFAPRIWTRAQQTVRNSTYAYPDDRPLYWARLKMVVAVKSHPAMLASITDRDELVTRLEQKSRGLGTVDFTPAGANKKLLLVALDPTNLNPFDTNHNVMASNPSGAAALALHGQTITTGGGVNIFVQVAVLPARYSRMDGSTGSGWVEELVTPHLSGGTKADMIITMNQGLSFEFDVLRYAARFRGGEIDNENKPSPPKSPRFIIPAGLAGAEFFQSTLPEVPMTAVATGHGFDIKHRRQFSYYYMNGNTKVVVDQSTVAGLSPEMITAATNPNLAQVKSVSGSGGSHLSNELFYRLALAASGVVGAPPVGHLDLPKMQAPAANIANGDRTTVDLDVTNTKAMIEETMEIIKRAF